MAVVFITGMSGVGKSAVLDHLRNMGYNAVDTDYDYVLEIQGRDGTERYWDIEKVASLLEEHMHSHLFLSGCCDNQGQFYGQFDHVVLLTCDLDVMLSRVENRSSNPYGKTEAERAEIIDNYKNVLPLLYRRAPLVIDTTNISVSQVAEEILALLKDA